MLGYLSADIICSEKRTVFRERGSRETVSYEEQIMSGDKYPSIFSPQMVTIVFIILQIFFATRAVLKIGEYSRIFPSFSWGIFGHVMCSDQSRASKNIWWIISSIMLNTEFGVSEVSSWSRKYYFFHETHEQGIMVVECNVSKKSCPWWIQLPWFPACKSRRGLVH